jgi:hypothetical protein
MWPFNLTAKTSVARLNGSIGVIPAYLNLRATFEAQTIKSKRVRLHPVRQIGNNTFYGNINAPIQAIG